MKAIFNRFMKPLYIVLAMLTAACTADVESEEGQQPLPEGMGRIRLTLCTPESHPDLTRAVNADPWEEPDHEWERLHSYRVLICSTDNKVVQIIAAENPTMTEVNDTNRPYAYKQTEVIVSKPLPAGNYYVYATANYADGYAVGQTVDLERTVKFPNGYSATSAEYFGEQRNIPMTGKLTGDDNKTPRAVEVKTNQETDAGILTVWRVMGKLQFEFANLTSSPVKILGIEVEPINQASTSGPGIFLFSKDNLTSTANLMPGATPAGGKEGLTLPTGARTDVGPVRYVPATALELDAKDGTNDKGNIFFYVNESDASFTTTDDQYSLRFKVQRYNAATSQWFTEEMRYGMTTAYTDGNEGGNGFNVIRRNDWIHIPVQLSDWQFRVEPLAYVPIAGYPAATISSDGLTATFSTGGPIILQAFAQKNNDGIWRSFKDPEVTFQRITWKNSDGTSDAGTGKLFVTAPTYDEDTGCIVGVLNNNLTAGTKTSITVSVKLGPADGPQYMHAFTFNVVLQK